MMTETQHLMLLAAEESIEVAQRLIKAIRFGLTEEYQGKSNAQYIAEERKDQDVVFSILEDKEEFNCTWNSEMHAFKKRQKIRKYMDYSRSLGQLEGLKIARKAGHNV